MRDVKRKSLQVSIPADDKVVWDWLAAQDNMSASVRELIRHLAYTVGNKDALIAGLHHRVESDSDKAPVQNKQTDKAAEVRVSDTHDVIDTSKPVRRVSTTSKIQMDASILDDDVAGTPGVDVDNNNVDDLQAMMDR